MPEGPEMRREARKIAALQGATVRMTPVNKLLTSAKHAEARARMAQLPEVVQIRRVLVHGKELFLELSFSPEGNEKDDEAVVYLRCHLGMGGGFYTLDGSDPKQRHAKGVAPRHVLVELVPTDGSHCGYGIADIRGFGKIGVMTEEEFTAHVAAKGPDVMSRAFTEERLREIMAAQRGSVAAALPNQRLMSGMGNYLRSETLWEARIDPHKPAKALTGEEVAALFRAIRAVSREVYEQGEAYKFRVYMRKEDREGNLTYSWGENQKVWWSPRRQEPWKPEEE
jgi:formamidopyrimidine-DNA glycosylase